MAVEAMALAPRIDCVAVAPAHETMQAAVDALRAQGVRVVSAGFSGESAGAACDAHHRLDQDCMFAP